MTEPRGTKDEVMKRTHRIAWTLVVIWAGWWTSCAALLFFLAYAFYPCPDCPRASSDETLRHALAGWPYYASLLFIGWGGGALLVSLLPKMVRRLSKR